MKQFKLMKSFIPLISFALCFVFLVLSVASVTAQTPPGTPWAWGENFGGELGNGTTDGSSVPVQVSNLTDVVVVAGGPDCSLAVDSNGNVWAWGWNYYGQLGNGTTTGSLVPIQVSNLTGVVAVAGGYNHNLALDSNGNVWAWGNGTYGQLGNGTTTGSLIPIPIQVNNPTGVVAVAGGALHSLAVNSNGNVWAWGKNSHGELGNGTTTDSLVPIQVSNLSGVVAVAGGYNHSLALDSNGNVWAWGNGTYGQLGSVSLSYVPVQVSNLTGVVAIAAGDNHSLALDSSGKVWAWGFGAYGELGNGTFISSSVPVQVSNLTGIVSIAAGQDHSLALDSNGNVWAWGMNWHGQLGNGTFSSSSVPVQSSNLTSVVSIAGGGFHSLAIVHIVCDTQTRTSLPAKSIPLGQSVTDNATVTNLGECSSQPTGTLTFQVSTNEGATWTDFGSVKDLDSNGNAASDPYIPLAAGDHYFRAVYGGDANHGGSQSGNADEKLTVKKASTTIETRLSDVIIHLKGSVRDTVIISTEAIGTLPAAGGTWTVEASKSSSFSSGVVVVDRGTVTGPLPFTVMTQSFTPTSPGNWYFRAIYSGDGNFSDSRSGDREEILKVSR